MTTNTTENMSRVEELVRSVVCVTTQIGNHMFIGTLSATKDTDATTITLDGVQEMIDPTSPNAYPFTKYLTGDEITFNRSALLMIGKPTYKVIEQYFAFLAMIDIPEFTSPVASVHYVDSIQ